MSIKYPSNITNCIERGSLSNTPVDTVLTSKVPLNSRNRTTMELYETKFSIKMTRDELGVLLDWYYNNLMRVLPFYFNDSITDEQIEYSFVDPPSYVHIGGSKFRVSFNLETL